MTTQTLASPKSGAHWALVGACGALLVCTLVFSAMFFLSGDHETQRAISDGQRLIINPKNAEVTGNMRSTKPVAPEADAASPEQPAPAEEATTHSGFDVGTAEDATITATGTAATEPVNDVLGKAALIAAENEAMNTAPVYPRTPISLAAAPNPALVEKTAHGGVPIKAAGTSPFEFYKRPLAAASSSKPKIAIVLLDVGTTKALAEQALTLPADITIAYNPYAPNAALWMENGRNMGHEAWLMLPTQATDFPASDPGSLAQLLSAKPEENAERLLETLARSTGYVGIITAADSAVVDRVSHLSPVLAERAKRGLAIMAAAPSGEPATLKIQRGADLSLIADLVLDEKLNPEAIAKQLAALEALATKNGKALGVIHATPLAINMLTEWHKLLSQKPLMLTPASALLADNP